MDWDSAYKCRLFSTSVRAACDVVCPLIRHCHSVNRGGLSCFLAFLPHSFCAGKLSPRGKCCYFFARGLVGVDKHLFQMVSLVITSMTLPLNHIFVLLLANIDVISKQEQLNAVENTKENLIQVIHKNLKTADGVHVS